MTYGKGKRPNPSIKDINTAIEVLKEVQYQLMQKQRNDHGFYQLEDQEVIGLYEARLTLERTRKQTQAP